MSVMTRPKNPRKAPKAPAPEAAAPRTPREAEAPDRGSEQMPHEAPESGRVKIAEAPDAGEGRLGLLEHEFTHGRSQS